MNENDRTEEQPQDTPPPEGTAETRELPPGGSPADDAGNARPKLTRLRSEGMLAGVAAGLGRHFNVDPVIFRIGFGVSLFFGGFGLLAYVALWLFLPDESGEAAVKSSRVALVAAIVLIGLVLVPAVGWGFWDGGPGWGSWGALWLIVPAAIAVGAYAILKDRGGPGSAGGAIAAVFLAAAAVTGFLLLALIAAAVTALGFGEIAAGLVVIAGLALIVGAFSGGLRWLIVPALALALGVGVAAAADIDVDDTIGNRAYTPLSANEIPDDGYELGIGKLDVHLGQLDWKREEVVALDVDLGMGQAQRLRALERLRRSRREREERFPRRRRRAAAGVRGRDHAGRPRECHSAARAHR